jgi:hypothetical protein
MRAREQRPVVDDELSECRSPTPLQKEGKGDRAKAERCQEAG